MELGQLENISILDNTGKLVLQQKGAVDLIDITGLQSGFYLVQLQFEEKAITKSIVKN